MTKYLLLALSFSIISCQTYKVNELPDKQLIWGSGGGFTGVVNQYILLENGQLFFVDGLKNTTSPCTKQSKKSAEAFFATCDSMGIADMKMHQPGNLYYFITHKSAKSENTLTWGAMDAEVDEQLKALYNDLQEVAESSKIKNKTKSETAIE